MTSVSPQAAKKNTHNWPVQMIYVSSKCFIEDKFA